MFGDQLWVGAPGREEGAGRGLRCRPGVGIPQAGGGI